MNEKKSLSLKRPIIFFLSFCGVGFSPKAPGTMGSLAIMPILYFFSQFHPPFILFLPILLLVTVFSCFLADHVEKEYEVHDPQWIVIDEVIGMTIAWLFVRNSNLVDHFIIFVLFRFFDIVKIYPANVLDRMEHGSGIILDDIVSGLYAGLLYALPYYFGFI